MSGYTAFDLWRNGIFIGQDQPQKTGLPRHIVALRKALLDYGCDIPDHLEFKSAEDESRCLDAIAKTLNVYEPERASFNFHLAQLKDIKRKAEELDKKGDCDWEPFFLKHFFDILLYQTGKKDEESDSTYYYPQFLKYSTRLSRPWSLFEGEGFRQDDRIGLPVPEPDWVSSYTVYNNLKGNTTENLSYGMLQHLAQHGLESDATGSLAATKKVLNPDRDSVCFPWLMVQHGKPGDPETQCNLEAANASAVAVMMFERLCGFVPVGIQGKANEHVPPVVVITTVQKVVRVWVTYSCKASSFDVAKYRMMCIWKGDMTTILDLMKFSAILCNAHKWALLEQRPRVSGYIDLWKARYPMEKPSTARQRQLGTPPDPKTIIPAGIGSEPSSLDDMEPTDRNRLLDLLELYQGILKDERRERERLMTQVDELQQKLQDLIMHLNSSNPSSPPSQSAQQTKTPQPIFYENSALTKSTPLPQQLFFTSAPDTSSTLDRPVLPLKNRPLVPLKQKSAPSQVSPALSKIFHEGVRVPWPSHPGKSIRVCFPKSAPTLETIADRTPIFSLPVSTSTQKPIFDAGRSLFGGETLSETKRSAPTKPSAGVKSSQIAAVQDKKQEPVLQTPVTSIFSNIQNASGGSGLFQTGSATTGSFSAGTVKPAAAQHLPKFKFGTPPKEQQPKEEQNGPASDKPPEFNFTTPLPKVDQNAPAAENLPKFNFVGPLPTVKEPATKVDFAAPLSPGKQPVFNFKFSPLPTSEDQTPGLTSALLANPPTAKEKEVSSGSIYFSTPFMAKDETHGSTTSALFPSPSTAKDKGNKTSGPCPALFSTPPEPKSKTASASSTTRPRGRDAVKRDDDSDTPVWRSPFSSEGENEEEPKGTLTSPAPRAIATPASTTPAPTKVSTKDAPKPAPAPARNPRTPSPPATRPTRSTRSTPDAESRTHQATAPDPIPQADAANNDDEKYDAGDEEDEEEGEGEGGASDREKQSLPMRGNAEKGAGAGKEETSSDRVKKAHPKAKKPKQGNDASKGEWCLSREEAEVLISKLVDGYVTDE